MRRRVCISLWASLAAFGAGCASSPSSTPSALLEWSAPRTYTDGKPIAGALTYGVYAGPCGEEARIASTAALAYAPGAIPGCAYVTAEQHGARSAPSNEVHLP